MNRFGIDFHDMEYGDLIKHVEESIRALRLRAYKEGYEQGRFDERIEGSGREQHQQHRRDEIVERAKRDIDELRDDMDDLFADFIVNREKRTVVALLRGYQSGIVYFRGIAKCYPDDCFNVHIGKAIALRRALGLEVPVEYLHAPQPKEVRVGDVVNGSEIDGFYSPAKRFTLSGKNGEDGGFFYRESASDWIEESQIGRIIDDSHDYRY